MNQRLSISEMLRGEAKPYLWLLDDDGMEMGFGKSGAYARHSHNCFVDFMFCFSGLTLGGARGSALLVQPRTPFGPLISGDFFFLKFLLTGPPYLIPDKIGSPECDYQVANSGGLVLSSLPFSLIMRYYDALSGEFEDLSVTGGSEELEVESSRGWQLQVTR